MQKTLLRYTSLLFLLLGLSSNAQVITGLILDQTYGETLPGATVYQDGTTNVTATDEDGKFTLDTKGLDNALMVRYIGYYTKRIDKPLIYKGKMMKVFLNEQLVSLDEVTIGKQGPFSRRELLVAFRKQFLGTSVAASRCKIINEDDLLLKYDIAKKKLTATARNPLQISNNYLEYDISFDLDELVVNYKSSESLEAFLIESSYFSGSTFYTDKSKNDKVNKKRMETFYGSTAHFMQSLANGKLKQENWNLYLNHHDANLKTYFEITDTLTFKKVMLIKKPERLVAKNPSEIIRSNGNRFAAKQVIDSTQMELKPAYFMPYYNKKNPSIIEFVTDAIYVDPNGNYTPIYGVIFGGHLGSLKAGDLLPIDFYESIKEKLNSSEN